MFRTLFIILFILTGGAVHAQVLSVKKGSVNFRSDAPLELIKASSDELKGKLDLNKKIFAFVIRINSFQGFNSPLQKEHFNENYLETKLYPDATFSGKIIEDIALSADGIYTIRAKGKLTVHGVAQERIIKAEITVKDGKVSLSSLFTLMLNEHNIPVPKVVHEKLASEIKIVVKAELE